VNWGSKRSFDDSKGIAVWGDDRLKGPLAVNVFFLKKLGEKYMIKTIPNIITRATGTHQPILSICA
jgi:hypothetical protein